MTRCYICNEPVVGGGHLNTIKSKHHGQRFTTVCSKCHRLELEEKKMKKKGGAK